MGSMMRRRRVFGHNSLSIWKHLGHMNHLQSKLQALDVDIGDCPFSHCLLQLRAPMEGPSLRPSRCSLAA